MRNNKRFSTVRLSRNWALLLSIFALAASYVHADDTEIYRPGEATHPYVMLLLDTSGSMSGGIADSSISESNPQRMATMKAALHQLLTDAGDDYHIGMARYTAPGGAIMYPVKRLGDLASVERAFAGGSFTDDFTAGPAFVVDGAELRLAAEESATVGVRIANVIIPRGATIESATLVLTTNAAYTGSAQVGARIAQQSNVPPITDQAAFDGITWSADEAQSAVIPEAGLQNQMTITVDVREQLNTRLVAADWAASNSLLFQVRALSGVVGVFSAEGTLTVPRSDGRLLNQYRPHLFVKYRVDAGNAHSAPPTTVRDALRGVVDLMPTIGDTPLIGAYFETAQYMHGKTVEFGRSRGNSNWRALMRVSSLESLSSAATLNRNAMCTNVALNSRACLSEEINGTPSYESPVAIDCSISPAIVMLTDGEPNNERCPVAGEDTGDLRCDLGRVDNELRDITGGGTFEAASCDGSDPWDCGIQLSKVLANPARFGVDDQPSIPTYTIGFGEGLDGDSESPSAKLMELARGGYGETPPAGTVMGRYYQANSRDDLSRAFNSIFGEVATGVKVQAATGISVDQTNRAQHSDQLYFSLFEPSKGMLWPGNLKRYKLEQPEEEGGIYTIVDADGLDAINLDGTFKRDSRSFWSSGDDGDAVSRGGALENIPRNRTVLTYLDDYPATFPSAGEELIALNASLASSHEYSSRLRTLLETTSNEESANVINWLTRSNEDQKPSMGAPLHAKPILVNYGFTGSNPVNTVFLSTNQGLLHAVNADDSSGEELFAFVPKELLKNQRHFVSDTGGNQLYGLDASWIAYRNDENLDGDVSDSDDFLYLYGGMRMGGNNYYALDVKGARSQSARLKFVITPSTEDGKFAQLGQTWSVPVLTRLADSCLLNTPIENCKSSVVMIFGGGYDFAAHEKVGDVMPRSTRDTYGAGLYIVDAKTGKLLSRAGSTGSGADITHGDLNFSITATIRTFDSDFDGYADHLYAVDLGGQILRFDLQKDEHGRSRPIIQRMKVVADLGGTDASALAKDYRRFYDAPAITSMRGPGSSRWVAIAVGSGYRSHPTDTQTDEMFFMVRDNEPFDPEVTQDLIELTDLADASANELSVEDEQGWFMELDRTGPADPGEKVVGEPFVLNENLVFSTYIPERPSALQCTPGIGRMAVYGVTLRKAAGILDINNDRVVERHGDHIVPGLVSGVALIQTILPDGTQKQLLSIGPKALEFNGGGGKNVVKTRWRSNEDDERVDEAAICK